MSTTPDQNGPSPAWLDMSRYPNLDPELAVDAPVLEALRDILHTSDLAPLPTGTWIAILREVLGTTAQASTTAQPYMSADMSADMPGLHDIVTPLWDHAPGPVAPYEPAYPETLNDDPHDPGPDPHPHPYPWLWESLQETQHSEVTDTHTIHPGPGPDHVI